MEINTNEFEAHGADTENAGQMFFAELLKTAGGYHWREAISSDT